MQSHLIQLLKTRDCAAITQLYDAYGGALFGIVLRIVYSKELAQQVMQDTFVKAWRNGADYDESKGKLFTWLLNIARNTAIDATRTSHFRSRGRTDTLDSLHHLPDTDAFHEDIIGLRDAMQKMDKKYAVLIDLIYFKGFTQEEASKAAGVSVSTVKVRLRQAIEVLRKDFA